MEISLYHAVLTYQDLPAKELFEKLEELKPGLFTDLQKIDGGLPYAKLALLYIIHAYSKHSSLIVLGERFADEKRKIADIVGLPEKLNGPVVLMQDQNVREVVLAYLKAQSDSRWQHLMQDKELYEAMRESSIKHMKKDDGTTDFKGMTEAAKIRRELFAAIEQQEQSYRTEYAYVIENREDIKKIKALQQSSKKGQSLSVENSVHIQ